MATRTRRRAEARPFPPSAAWFRDLIDTARCDRPLGCAPVGLSLGGKVWRAWTSLSRPLRRRLLRGGAVAVRRAHQFEGDVAAWAAPLGLVRVARYMRPLPPGRGAEPAPSSGALPEPDKQPAGGGCSQAIEPSRYLSDLPPLRWEGPVREPESPFGVGLGTALGLGEPEDEAARYARVVTSHHKPSEEQARRIERLRLHGEQFIVGILRLSSSNADRTAAVRLARQALQSAVASIVVPDVPLPGGQRG